METSPQKKKKKKNDIANHLKQSKSYAYSEPGLLCSRSTLELHSSHNRFCHLADLSEFNWGMNTFEVWLGKAKMQYPIMKITKMDKFGVEDMWLGLLHIFG